MEPGLNPQNPLFIDAVLVTIFKYLRPRDLTACRAVCRAWKDLSTPFLQDRIQSRWLEFDAQRPHKTDLEFLEMTSNSRLRFCNFSFKNFQIDYGVLGNYCEWITSLKLSYEGVAEGQGQELRIFNLDLNELLSNLPNLESLEIQELPGHVRAEPIILKSGSGSDHASCAPLQKLRSLSLRLGFREPAYSARFLEDLFSLCPNLQNLSVENECDYVNQAQELLILQSLVRTSKHSCHSLAKLRLCLVSSEMMETVTASFPRLRQFTATLLDRIGSDTFQGFLNSQQGSLEDFSFGLSRCNGLRVTFPAMPHLRSLSIAFHHAYAEGRPSLGTLDYAALFPNLIKLRIEDQSSGDLLNVRKAYIPGEIFPVPGISVLESVEDLELPQNLEGPQALQGMIQMFPNLKRLTVGAQRNISILREIWSSPTWCVSLRSLRLSFYSNASPRDSEPDSKLDSLLTGIPKSACERKGVELLKWNRKLGLGWNQGSKSAGSVASSLANLKNLSYLVISSWNLPEPSVEVSAITDLTGYAVFAHMRELKGIRIENGVNEISSTCQDWICRSVGLINVFPDSRHLRPKGLVQLVKYEWQNTGPVNGSLDFDFEA